PGFYFIDFFVKEFLLPEYLSNLSKSWCSAFAWLVAPVAEIGFEELPTAGAFRPDVAGFGERWKYPAPFFTVGMVFAAYVAEEGAEFGFVDVAVCRPCSPKMIIKTSPQTPLPEPLPPRRTNAAPVRSPGCWIFQAVQRIM